MENPSHNNAAKKELENDCSGLDQSGKAILRDLIVETIADETLRSVEQVSVEAIDLGTRVTLNDEGKIRVTCNAHIQTVLTKRRAVVVSLCSLMVLATASQFLLERLVGLHKHLALLASMFG